MNPTIDNAPFQPLKRGSFPEPTQAQIEGAVKTLMKAKPFMSQGAAREAVIEGFQRDREGEIWYSSQYTVIAIRNCQTSDGFPPMDWLSIRRDDRQPVRDWRHLQAIKNQLCGADREGVELYPNEERLVDTANQFHLWVLRDAGAIFPFGFDEGRNVSDFIDPDMGAQQRQGAGQ